MERLLFVVQQPHLMASWLPMRLAMIGILELKELINGLIELECTE